MGTAKLMTSNITVPTDDADAFIKEIKTYIDNDMIVSKSLVPIIPRVLHCIPHCCRSLSHWMTARGM